MGNGAATAPINNAMPNRLNIYATPVAIIQPPRPSSPIPIVSVFPYLFDSSGIESKPKSIPTNIRNTQNTTRAVLIPKTEDRCAFGTIDSGCDKCSVNVVSPRCTFTHCLVRRTLAVTGVAAKSLMLPNNATRRLRLTASLSDEFIIATRPAEVE